VSVVFDAGMSRPLRLTAEEALALVVALRTLAETPGLADSEAVQRALAKVETAAGGAVDDTTVAIELDELARTLPVLQRALDERRALLLRYYTATRDETTERDVDPVRLFQADGHDYLEAWCRSAEGMRVFRVDRVEYVELLDEPSAPPANVALRNLDEGVFQPADDHLLATLRLSPAYFWVADYYSTDDVAEVGGTLHVKLRVADPAWVRALVLGSAGQVEVLSPHWLTEDVRAEAERALGSYAGYGAK
jgi:proteasome accessory factor C